LATRTTRGSTRVGSLVAGEAEPRTGAERTSVREHRSAESRHLQTGPI
jgi:hypothetical protein